jgi:hypothetical protein
MLIWEEHISQEFYEKSKKVSRGKYNVVVFGSTQLRL